VARRATDRTRDHLLAAGGLLLIVAVGLALRLRHNDYGLPYSYVADENTHFTVHAVQMFRDDANPEYFRNPSAFTYLLHGCSGSRSEGSGLSRTCRAAIPSPSSSSTPLRSSRPAASSPPSCA
jgi:hypothetical protein